jgi:hypothetical protein
MRYAGCLILAVLLLLTAACGQPEEKAQPAAPAKPQAAPPSPQQQREAELKKLSQQFQGLQRRISRLQGAIDKMPSAAKAKLEKQMATLLQQQGAVAQKLTDLGQADEKAWSSLAPGVAAASQSLQQSYEQTLKAAAPYLTKKKEAYAKITAAKLAAMQRQLKSLQTRIKTRPPAQKHRLTKEAEAVHQKLTTAENRLATLKAAGPLTWQELRPGVNAAVKDLGAAYAKLAAQVKGGTQHQKKKAERGTTTA